MTKPLAPIGAFIGVCPIGVVLYYMYHMLINIPGQSYKLRLFHPVETVDAQYHVIDVGIQQANGGIDSIAVGAATHSFSSWQESCAEAESDRLAKEQAKRDKKAAKKAAARAEAGIPDPEPTANVE